MIVQEFPSSERSLSSDFGGSLELKAHGAR